MTFTLRDYQVEAVEAGLDALAAAEDSLLVVPTGGGKSGIAGTLKRRLFDEFDGLRILNVTHVAELVDQNYQELIGMWDWAPAGVYSAGLGRREMNSRILFAGIQSIHKKAHLLGQVDVLMVDEAHLIPRNADTMYGRFVETLREHNPDMRLLGLTATPFRLDSGRLDEGDDRMFEKVACDIGIRRLIDDGYLTGLVTKATATTLNVQGVAKRGGDFVAGALQAAVDKDNITRPIVDEIVEYGQSRKSWLIFASGVEHAHHVADEIRRRGFSCDTITGDTPPGERRRIIEDFKAGRTRALTNASVLTTGFNAPGVDLLAMIRPTESAGLYIQICGRGTRNVYAPGGDLSTREGRLEAIASGVKPNCLVLDFAGNIRRHGPIDMVQPRKPGKGGGDAPVKECPQCHSVVHASVMDCPDCGFHWERQLSEKITQSAAVAPILSKTPATWAGVSRRNFARHSKFGSPDSLRIEYWRGLSLIAKEWWAFESEKGAWKAGKEWKACGGAEPAPATVDEAIERITELRPVAEIRIEADGKFWRITGRKFGGDAEDQVEKPSTGNLARNGTYYERMSREQELLDEEIPF